MRSREAEKSVRLSLVLSSLGQVCVRARHLCLCLGTTPDSPHCPRLQRRGPLCLPTPESPYGPGSSSVQLCQHIYTHGHAHTHTRAHTDTCTHARTRTKTTRRMFEHSCGNSFCNIWCLKIKCTFQWPACLLTGKNNVTLRSVKFKYQVCFSISISCTYHHFSTTSRHLLQNSAETFIPTYTHTCTCCTHIQDGST